MMEMQTICGTDQYMAPEFFNNSVVYDEKVDVYSLGVILHLMLKGRFPDVQAQRKGIKINDLSAEYPFIL